jgi:SNF2 family DNA or RNA helicase
MPGQFVVVITSHRKLGEIFLPYLINRNPEQSFFQLIDILSIDNYKNYNLDYSENEVQLIKLISEYSDKNIHKLFSKKKNLKEFFDSLDDKYIEEHIRPFIEKKISKCAQILTDTNIKVYKKDKKYQVVHDDEQVFLEKETVHPVFNFIRSEVDFNYFLTIRAKDKDLKLFGQKHIILSQLPSVVMINNIIYQVENIDSKKLLPFFTKDHITVPKTSEKSYLDTFVKNTILNFHVKAIGFKIQESRPEGKAVLTLVPNLIGEPVLTLHYHYNNSIFSYADPSNACVYLSESNEGYVFLKIIRDTNWEESVIQKFDHFELEHQDGNAFQLRMLTGEPLWQFYEMINWLNNNSAKLRESGFEIRKSQYDKDFYLDEILLELKVDEIKDWFDIQATVKIGDFQFPFSRFRKHIIMNIREFTLPNNQVVILPSAWFSRYRDMFVFGNEEEDRIKLKKHHFQLLNEAMGADTSDLIIKLKDKLVQNQSDEFIEPSELQAQLREYQKTGVHWMYQLHKNNMGGCLADDMGLGKTLQTITLLLKVKDEARKETKVPVTSKPLIQLSLFDIPAFTGSEPLSTSLIVMPVSLLHNWENEIHKFAPTLKVHKFFGTQRTRNFSDLLNVDIVLASYGVVRNDVEKLSELNFKYIILDESQLIKNPDSKVYKAVIQLQSEHKLVLTGTPIENSLTDLWAQLNFLNRDLLKSQGYFREEFVIPIEKHNDEEKQRKLQMIISPFILRRKKEEVVKELPSLTEQVIYCEMTDEQSELYEIEKSSVRNIILDSINNQGFERSSILILKALNRLRLMANHPKMVIPGYTNESGKFDEIIRSVENVIDEKHKVLIFSSYVKHLNLVEEYLIKSGHRYSMLTGATRDRQKVIETFQNDEDNRVFLISLKAGGTGLNLTAADYVFIIDPWWNPASENQAISRAHRIGQDKKVFVYRYLSRDTVEEKIQKLQQQKSAMAELFINSNNPFRSYRKEEIEDLFK